MQDRRKELAKSVSKFAEDSKVALRNVRKDIMKKIEKVEFPKVGV
jgi:ribosome recycling factor